MSIKISTPWEYYVPYSNLFIHCAVKDAHGTNFLLKFFSQWRGKLVLGSSGVHAVENNMPTINQEKIGFPIFRWIVLSLSSFPTNWVICTGNAITAATGRDFATTNTSGLFFFLKPFSQVIEGACFKRMGRHVKSSQNMHPISGTGPPHPSHQHDVDGILCVDYQCSIVSWSERTTQQHMGFHCIWKWQVSLDTFM